jgi:hypothetical protein
MERPSLDTSATTLYSVCSWLVGESTTESPAAQAAAVAVAPTEASNVSTFAPAAAVAARRSQLTALGAPMRETLPTM